MTHSLEKRWIVKLAFAMLSGILVARAPVAAQGGVSALVTAGLEYDDNLGLALEAPTDGGATTGPEGGLVFQLEPRILATLGLGEDEGGGPRHRLVLDLGGELRQELDTRSERSDENLDLEGRVELGLGERLTLAHSYAYDKVAFDQELRGETGIPDSSTTRFDTRMRWTGPAEDRLEVELGFDRQEQAFDFDETAQGGQADRTVEGWELLAVVPRSGDETTEGSSAVYLELSSARQKSLDTTAVDRPDRDYTDRRGLLGWRWSGRRVTVLRLAVGAARIEFPDLGTGSLGLEGGLVLDEPVAEMGFYFRTPSQRLEINLAVGRDGFGELAYEMSARRDPEGGDEGPGGSGTGDPGVSKWPGPTLGLRLARRAEPSFSFQFDSAAVSTTSIDLEAGRRSSRRLALLAKLSYQHQESLAFGLTSEERDDRLLLAGLEAEVELDHWLVAARYRVARRATAKSNKELTNHRIGVFVTRTFGGDRR